ncbi:hypothetical protein [[Mycobacterium] zoologicum]|uniref:hypothetical protein n=1 Tax=[Mycobacterium] zoologicum TaxID=2872311 RepID=UPI002C56C13A|nr:hypothetical protein [Mycolicibacter sp. MYC101]MEB3065669.1 hypothetical protein [Mycolicibacter sp. MYC101]
MLYDHHSRRSWARRSESILEWVECTAYAATGITNLTGRTQWSAIATVVGATAGAASRITQWWAARCDRPVQPGDL